MNGTDTSTPPPRRWERMLVTIDCDGLTCDACGQPIKAHSRVSVYSVPPIVTHKDGCPRVALSVIAGSGGGDRQLTLPLLEAVPDEASP